MPGSGSGCSEPWPQPQQRRKEPPGELDDPSEPPMRSHPMSRPTVVTREHLICLYGRRRSRWEFRRDLHSLRKVHRWLARSCGWWYGGTGESSCSPLGGAIAQRHQRGMLRRIAGPCRHQAIGLCSAGGPGPLEWTPWSWIVPIWGHPMGRHTGAGCNRSPCKGRPTVPSFPGRPLGGGGIPARLWVGFQSSGEQEWDNAPALGRLPGAPRQVTMEGDGSGAGATGRLGQLWRCWPWCWPPLAFS